VGLRHFHLSDYGFVLSGITCLCREFAIKQENNVGSPRKLPVKLTVEISVVREGRIIALLGNGRVRRPI
jgi:hypothetical protein